MSMRKTAAPILIGLMALGSLSGAAERQGAQVVVILKSGVETAGELLAVKKDFLVLSLPPASQGAGVISDESIAVADIREVKVIRRSKAGIGALAGLLFGVGIGAAAAAFAAEDEGLPHGSWPYEINLDIHVSPALIIAGCGLGYAGLGAVIGAVTSKDRTLFFKNKPESVKQANLVVLGRYARIRGVQ